MVKSKHRLHIPVSVKLHSALLELGYTDEEITQGGIEWDHNPPLALRIVNPETGQLEPHPNDPHYITPTRKADHHRKTNGTKATTAGSDEHKIAKAKRIAEQEEKRQAETRRKLLAPECNRDPEPPHSRWPKRKLQSRGSMKKGRAMRGEERRT